jgi:hypothetical protein
MARHWRQVNLGVIGMTHTISGFFVMIVLPQRYIAALSLKPLASLFFSFPSFPDFPPVNFAPRKR